VKERTSSWFRLAESCVASQQDSAPSANHKKRTDLWYIYVPV
jgi:hypothetical protein